MKTETLFVENKKWEEWWEAFENTHRVMCAHVYTSSFDDYEGHYVELMADMMT